MMEVAFASRKLEKLCNSDKELRAKHGDRNAALIQQRLAELKAADTLADMVRLPGAACHELVGNRKGQLAVKLVHPLRLVFQSDHQPVPRKADGGLDWLKVTAVIITEIVDYH